MCPRRYESNRRRTAAEATRTHILEATRAIVGGKGDLDRFSMDAVAQRAGVARMTVYYQFRSRAGLLEALADHLAARGGIHRMREVFMDPDLESALGRLVSVFVGFWSSDRVTLRRMRAMAVVFPSRDGAARDRDAWRREAVTNLLQRSPRRPAPDRLRAAVDLITALTSFETFDGLCSGGRTPDEVARLITPLAVAEARGAGLLGPRA